MKTASMVVAVLLAFVAAAQAEVQSLAGEGYWRLAIRPEYKMSDMADDFAGIAGVQMGPSLNRSLYTGIGGYALVNSVSSDEMSGARLGAFDFWYAGFVLDYTFAASHLVHGALNGLIGGGSVSADFESGGSESADLFVAEPTACVMVNLANDIEFGVGCGYRIVNGSNIDGLSDSDLGGVTGSIFFRWTEM